MSKKNNDTTTTTTIFNPTFYIDLITPSCLHTITLTYLLKLLNTSRAIAVFTPEASSTSVFKKFLRETASSSFVSDASTSFFTSRRQKLWTKKSTHRVFWSSTREGRKSGRFQRAWTTSEGSGWVCTSSWVRQMTARHDNPGGGKRVVDWGGIPNRTLSYQHC